MVIESTAHDFIQWLMLQEVDLAFGRRSINFEVIDDRMVRVFSRHIADLKVVREHVVTLAVVPLGSKLEIGWLGGVGQWREASGEFLDRLSDRIKHTWPEAYNDFECFPETDNRVSTSKAMTEGVEWRARMEQVDQANRALEHAEDCDYFELFFLDTPARLAREVKLFDADRSIYHVDDRDAETLINDMAKESSSNTATDTGTRRIAPDADLITVTFFTHITGTFGASYADITARAWRDGISRLTCFIGRNPGTQERWSDLREELERLRLLTPPTEARTDLTHHHSFIVKDAEDRRVAIALAKAWQPPWAKLLSDTDTLVTRPAEVFEPRGPLMNYVVRVRGHMVRHDGRGAHETNMFDVLWCEVIQGGNSCKVQIDYIGEADEWRLHAIDELNEIFHTDAIGTRHKGSIHDLPAERAALIIGDELRALDHDWFSYIAKTEPGGRWVWTVCYGPVNDRPRIGEITAGPGRGVGFASAAMERALQRDPDLTSMTPRARDEISKFGRLVTRIHDAGAFEADTVLPAIAARSVSTETQPDAATSAQSSPFKVDRVFKGTPCQFAELAQLYRKLMLDSDEWFADFNLSPEKPDQKTSSIEVSFHNGIDIDTVYVTLCGDGYSDINGFLWKDTMTWKGIEDFLERKSLLFTPLQATARYLMSTVGMKAQPEADAATPAETSAIDWNALPGTVTLNIKGDPVAPEKGGPQDNILKYCAMCQERNMPYEGILSNSEYADKESLRSAVSRWKRKNEVPRDKRGRQAVDKLQ